MPLSIRKLQLIVNKGDDYLVPNQALIALMRDILAKGATFRFRATGWSMIPFIKDGDVITVAPLQDQVLSLGSIVAYVQPSSGHLIVHRLIGRQGTSSIIQGDNTLTRQDDLVPQENILGYVTLIERAGHHVPLGLGPERKLIALLSRNGWLLILLNRLRAMKAVYLNKFR